MLENGVGSRSEPCQFPFGPSRGRKEGLRGVASHGNHHPTHASPLNEFLRISIGTEAQNERVLKALGSLMKKRGTDS